MTSSSSNSSCTQKSKPLLDVQNLQSPHGIDLQRVGVKNVEVPLCILQKDGKTQTVSANITMSVGLSHEFKGTHMSRFIVQLTEWSQGKVITLDLREFLLEAQKRLNSKSAQIDLDFKYFINKSAPVTKQTAPMAYACSISASSVGIENPLITLGVSIPISTLCPCSKEISDYGAHNQRAFIHVKVLLDTSKSQAILWLEDLISELESCSSCPVYPLLKRADEKYVTEKQYDNPKFVEDVIREATALLRKHEGIRGFELEVEAIESIHGHNAWAAHVEPI